MTVNAKLLHQVADAITERPERYYQGSWVGYFYDDSSDLIGPAFYDLSPGEQATRLAEIVDPEPVCGSTFCIAGWAVALSSTAEERKQAIERTKTRAWSAGYVDPSYYDVCLVDVVGERLDVRPRWFDVASALLGVSPLLFEGCWAPAGQEEGPENDALLVAAALRRLADGATFEEVTAPWAYELLGLDG